jgi:hypothetical protein
MCVCACARPSTPRAARSPSPRRTAPTATPSARPPPASIPSPPAPETPSLRLVATRTAAARSLAGGKPPRASRASRWKSPCRADPGLRCPPPCPSRCRRLGVWGGLEADSDHPCHPTRMGPAADRAGGPDRRSGEHGLTCEPAAASPRAPARWLGRGSIRPPRRGAVPSHRPTATCRAGLVTVAGSRAHRDGIQPMRTRIDMRAA